MKRLILNDDERVGRWVCERLDTDWLPGRGHCMGMEEGGRLISGVLFDSYNGASICMHVAAEPGKRWMTKNMLWYAFAYPFLQLRVKKILGLVAASDRAVRAFDEHLGFVLEATLKDAHPDGDLLIYSMTRAQCRWLDIRGHNLGQTKSSPAAELREAG